MMKAFAAGVVGAVLAATLSVVAQVAFIFVRYRPVVPEGIGSFSIQINGTYLAIAAVVGFVLGYRWMRRRQRRRFA